MTEELKLVETLKKLGERYGAMGVALAAAHIAGPVAVGRKLLERDGKPDRDWPNPANTQDTAVDITDSVPQYREGL